MAALDANEVAGLAADVPREAPPSPHYQGVWQQIEHARQIKGFQTSLDERGNDPVQKWAGFSRSTWFIYKAKGSIPLHIFARLLARLGLKYRLEVRPIRGYLKGTPAPEVVTMSDTEEARRAADIINQYDVATRRAMLIAVQDEVIKLGAAPRPLLPAVATPDSDR